MALQQESDPGLASPDEIAEFESGTEKESVSGLTSTAGTSENEPQSDLSNDEEKVFILDLKTAPYLAADFSLFAIFYAILHSLP